MWTEECLKNNLDHYLYMTLTPKEFNYCMD